MKDKLDNLYNNIINRYSVFFIFNFFYMVLKKKCLMVCWEKYDVMKEVFFLDI